MNPAEHSSPHSDKQQLPTSYQDLFHEAQAEQHETRKPPYTGQELVRVIIDSFRFSQGSPPLQEKVLEYFTHHDRQRIAPDELSQARAELKPVISKIVRTPSTHDPNNQSGGPISDQFINQDLGDLQGFLNKQLAHPTEVVNQLPHALGEGFIARDYRYIVTRPEGRTRVQREKDGQTQPDPEEGRRSRPASRYLSQVVYYGLLERPTETDTYDRMYQEATADLLRHWDDAFTTDFQPKKPRAKGQFGGPPEPVGKSVGQIITEVAQVHFAHYPEDLQDLRPELRQRLGLAAPAHL